MSIRDANVIIIEITRTVVRARLGLHELLKIPSVEIPACVGLRNNASGDGIDTNGDANGTDENLASTSRAPSTFPQNLKSSAAVNDYLVGTQLDESLAASQDISIFWPFAEGDVKDWTQAEAIWKYILFNQLQRKRVQNESPVLLSFFAGLSRDTYERTCQIFFERFNCAGFSIIERPMAQMYSVNSLFGIIVDIGEEQTDITPIYEGFIIHSARCSTPIGTKDCQNYLAHLLRSNQSVMSALSPVDNPTNPDVLHGILLELVKQIWEEGHVKVPSDGETVIPEDEGVTDIAAVVVAGKEKAVIESGMKKKATAKASAAEQARAREIEAMDLVTIQFREHSLTLGKERHRFCEPLFDPSLMNGLSEVQKLIRVEEPPLSLQEIVGHAVNLTALYQRPAIWNGLVVTGDITRYVKGIGIALQSRLSPYITSPDLQSEIQPRYIRVLSVPEYYAEYRETGNGLAAFLGSSITAKIIFNENTGKSFVSKADYTSNGPQAIIETTASLL